MAAPVSVDGHDEGFTVPRGSLHGSGETGGSESAHGREDSGRAHQYLKRGGGVGRTRPGQVRPVSRGPMPSVAASVRI